MPDYTAEQALARLIAGNDRFVRGEARFPTVQKEVLAELSKHPVTTRVSLTGTLIVARDSR